MISEAMASSNKARTQVMFDFSMFKHDNAWNFKPNTSEARRFVAEHQEFATAKGALYVPLKNWLQVAREVSAKGLAIEVVSRCGF